VLIDWFTVAAQIVNFLILVFLLKHFLYDRILKAMDRREERIQNRLEEAQSKKQEAEQEAETHRRERRDLEAKRSDMLAEAAKEAEKERKRLVQEARDQVASLRQKWQTSLDREKASFTRELRLRAGREVYAVCRKALRDLADADVEIRMVQVLLQHLTGLEEDERSAMARAALAAGTRVAVRSGFDLPSGLEQELTRGIQEHLGGDIEVAYETDSDQGPGIELRMNGRKLSWGFENYLDELEARALDALEHEPGREEKEAAA
jgi:F-type H+-transporting ATPase subunit b